MSLTTYPTEGLPLKEEFCRSPNCYDKRSKYDPQSWTNDSKGIVRRIKKYSCEGVSEQQIDQPMKKALLQGLFHFKSNKSSTVGMPVT